MKVMNKQYCVQRYRNYRLRKDTPEILRTLYVERQGNINDLTGRYGGEKVEEQFYLGHISKKTDGRWKLTKDGKEDIDVFHTKQTPLGVLKSILFGFLAK